MAGRSVDVEIDRDARDVVIADPRIVNVVVVSPRRFVVLGTAEGATTVLVLDTNGRRVAFLDVKVLRDLSLLHQAIGTAVPSARITVSGVSDTVILTGDVGSSEDAELVMQVAKGFVWPGGNGEGKAAVQVVNAMSVRGRDQVMLKVTVAEVRRSILRQLGIATGGEWQVTASSSALQIAGPLGFDKALATQAGASVANSLSLKLDALERAGALRTLAEPTLTAISGETARFTAGGEVPVPGSGSCTAGLLGQSQCSVSVTYRQVGVSLSFTPVVLTPGRISLHVEVEVTDADPSSALQISSTTAIGFRTRKMATSVELASGASLVSAGLLQHAASQAVSGFPGLIDLPVIGPLFRSRDFQREDSELLIGVTPYIARPLLAGPVARPEDAFTQPSSASSDLIRTLVGLYGGNPSRVPGDPGSRAGFVIE